MVIVFTFGFFEFAKLSSGMENQAMQLSVSIETASNLNVLIAGSQNKIGFAEGNPKMFLGVNSLPNTLAASEGSLVLGENEMVIGYAEGMMMKEEKLIKSAGDSLKDFFGLPSIKVVGILKPTGTLVDSYHFVNDVTLSKMTNSADIRYVAEKEIIKGFYYVNASSTPEKIKSSIQGFDPIMLGGKRYLPIYIGASEAKMMIEAKLFNKVGDTINNLFGNDVIIAGILPETKTTLDMFHYVGKEFEIKQ
jgi:hypothetical protein